MSGATSNAPSDPREPQAAAADERKPSRARQAWRIYQWWSRARWVRWLLAGEAAKLAPVGVFVAGVAGWTVSDAVESARIASEASRASLEAPRAVPEAPRAVAAEQVGQGSSAFLITGRDKAGRQGVFDLIVSSKAVGWVRGSTAEIDKDGARLSAEAITVEVFGEDVRRRLAAAREVIAVGLASQEGNRQVETERAQRRAEQTAVWLRTADPNAPPIRSLNLGQYVKPCETCESAGTSWQRPLIVIGVRSFEAGTDVREALMDAMARATNLPKPEAYSAFELSQ